jgi:hypothetical protein
VGWLKRICAVRVALKPVSTTRRSSATPSAGRCPAGRAGLVRTVTNTPPSHTMNAVGIGEARGEIRACVVAPVAVVSVRSAMTPRRRRRLARRGDRDTRGSRRRTDDHARRRRWRPGPARAALRRRGRCGSPARATKLASASSRGAAAARSDAEWHPEPSRTQHSAAAVTTDDPRALLEASDRGSTPVCPRSSVQTSQHLRAGHRRSSRDACTSTRLVPSHVSYPPSS